MAIVASKSNKAKPGKGAKPTGKPKKTSKGAYHKGPDGKGSGFQVWTPAPQVNKVRKVPQGWKIESVVGAGGAIRATLTMPDGTLYTASNFGKLWGLYGGTTDSILRAFAQWGIAVRPTSIRQMVTTGKLKSEGQDRAPSTGITPPPACSKTNTLLIKAQIAKHGKTAE